jgi:DNA (cytosine-5)-methyltransferase 1
MRRQKTRKPLFIDAFAGCGGLSLGLMQAGLEGRFAIEHDKFAFETLKSNLLAPRGKYKFRWPRWLPKRPIGIGALLSKHERELRKLRGQVDLLVGGPPCQGFSSAGRREHDDPRNRLFRDYLKLVDLIKPKAVLIENVRGFTMDFEPDAKITNYADKLRQLLSEKYDVYEELLNLSEFGVPQSRTRYFLIAVEPGLCASSPFDMLREKLPTFLRRLGISAPVSSSAAISDLELGKCGRRSSRECPGFDEINYVKPLTRFQKLMRGNGRKPTDLRLARHAPKIAGRFAEIIELSHDEGRLNTTLSDEVRAKYGLKKRALRVLDPDRPSPTVTSMPDDLLHYKEPRTLTVRENARLQSFPDWFWFRGKYTTGGHLRKKEVPRFTQVANAVPPLVARAIGELMVEIFSAKPVRAEKISPRSRWRLQRLQQSSEIAAQA